MKSTFEPLGKYVRFVDERNKNMTTEVVLGINIDKYFMSSVANVIGTDLSGYKLLRKGRFACNPMHVGRDGRLPVAYYTQDCPAIVSPAYFMFEVIDETVIDPEYLMICFKRQHFDKMCWFRTDASVRAGITWDDVCALQIPLIEMHEQKRIIYIYNTILSRIDLLNSINLKIQELLDTMFYIFFYKETLSNNNVSVGWKKIPLSEVLRIDANSIDPQKITDTSVWHYSIPAFDNDGLPTNDNPKEILSNKYLVSENAILVSKLNPETKRIWITDKRYENAICSTEFIVFVPNNPKHKSFYYCLFHTRSFAEFLMCNASGSTNSRIRVKPKSVLDYITNYPTDDIIIDTFCSIIDPFVERFMLNIKEIKSLKEMMPTVVERLLLV